MIIYIEKRYWYYHENSDSVFKATRKEYQAGLNTAEGSFVHEIGPVITGTKEEGDNLLRLAQSAQDLISLNSPTKYWYKKISGVTFISEDPDLENGMYLIRVGIAFENTERDFKRAWEIYLEEDLPF